MIKLHPAYVAGLVDGEGTLGIRRYRNSTGQMHYRPMIEVFNTHKKCIDTLREFFGANGCCYKRLEEVRKKPLYTVRLTGKNCLKILDFVEPYLIIKKDQAKVLRKIVNRIGNSGDKWSDDFKFKENKVRHSLYLQIRKLNSNYQEK